jgi:hypothetical protein
MYYAELVKYSVFGPRDVALRRTQQETSLPTIALVLHDVTIGAYAQSTPLPAVLPLAT